MSENKLIQISNKDWHYRLVKFCWGINPMKFRNLCPYFWLTIASIFCVLPIALYKAVRYCITTVYDGLCNNTKVVIKNIKVRQSENAINNLSKGDIYFIMNRNNAKEVFQGMHLNHYLYLDDKTGRNFAELKKYLIEVKKYKHETVNKEFKNDYLREVAKYHKIEADKEAKRIERSKSSAESSAKFERRMTNIAYKVSALFKFIFKTLFALLIVITAYFLTNLLTYSVIEMWYESLGVDWYAVLKFIGIVCLVGVGIFAFIKACKYLLPELINAIDHKEEYKGYKKPLIYGTYYFLNGILELIRYTILGVLYFPFYVFLWKIVICGIANGFKEGFNEFGGIFADYFNASYSDYCPGIDWKKED